MMDRFVRFLHENVMVWEAYSSKPLRFLAETSQTSVWFVSAKKRNGFEQHSFKTFTFLCENNPNLSVGMFPQGSVMVLKNMPPKPLRFFAKNTKPFPKHKKPYETLQKQQTHQKRHKLKTIREVLRISKTSAESFRFFVFLSFCNAWKGVERFVLFLH